MSSPEKVKAVKADAKTDIHKIQKKAEADVHAVKKTEAASVKAGQKTKNEAAADTKKQGEVIVDVATGEIQTRNEQAKSVLKAEYKAMELKPTDATGKDGKAAGSSDGTGGATSAGSLDADAAELDAAAAAAGGALLVVAAAAVEFILDLIFGKSTAAAQAPKEQSTSNRAFDYRGNFNFRIEVGGIAAGAFRAVEGLSTSVELIEYQGGGDMYARQIPGRPKIAPVTLKKGWVVSAALWQWMQDTMEGRFSFHNVSVVLMDDDGQTDVARYELSQCWPSSWKGFQLDGMGNEAMVEELELQVRGISRVSP
jgi:phage tail-like protein